MRALGDKISSTIVAQSALVPTMPWSGSGITVDTPKLEREIITVPDDLYRRACVMTAEEGLCVAEKISFPVMIKASEGGGTF